MRGERFALYSVVGDGLMSIASRGYSGRILAAPDGGSTVEYRDQLAVWLSPVRVPLLAISVGISLLMIFMVASSFARGMAVGLIATVATVVMVGVGMALVTAIVADRSAATRDVLESLDEVLHSCAGHASAPESGGVRVPAT